MGGAHSIMANMLDFDIIVSKLEPSCYYNHFLDNSHEKSMNPLIPASYGLNTITAVLLHE